MRSRIVLVHGPSMLPTLRSGDILLVNELAYRVRAPRSGEIAVFKPPVAAPANFIKRVVGTPGETFRVVDGTVYANGKALAEPFVRERPRYDLEVKNYGIYVNGYPLDTPGANIPPRVRWQFPDHIPKGYFFVMGDNRNDSDDSHVWGFAERAQFTGRAVVVFWPLDHFRILP